MPSAERKFMPSGSGSWPELPYLEVRLSLLNQWGRANVRADSARGFAQQMPIHAERQRVHGSRLE